MIDALVLLFIIGQFVAFLLGFRFIDAVHPRLMDAETTKWVAVMLAALSWLGAIGMLLAIIVERSKQGRTYE